MAATITATRPATIMGRLRLTALSGSFMIAHGMIDIGITAAAAASGITVIMGNVLSTTPKPRRLRVPAERPAVSWETSCVNARKLRPLRVRVRTKAAVVPEGTAVSWAMCSVSSDVPDRDFDKNRKQ